MRDQPFWTTTQLAQEGGVTQAFVRQEIRAGRLKADKWGRDWAIWDEEAQMWLAKRRKRKRADQQQNGPGWS